MKLIKYGALLIVVIATMSLLGWLPERLLNPVRKYEVNALYYVFTEAPGGFDDAVQTFIMRNPGRYASSLVYMLKTSEQGSRDEETALFFVELVLNEPGVRSFLLKYAESHPEPDVRRFVETILEL